MTRFVLLVLITLSVFEFLAVIVTLAAFGASNLIVAAVFGTTAILLPGSVIVIIVVTLHDDIVKRIERAHRDE